MSSLLGDILEVFQCQSTQANDGEEALRLLKEEEYDLVITDMRMPKMSGLDLLRFVKDNHPKLPVVVISGFNLGPQQDALVSEIADGFLSKPFKVQDIEKLLKNLLNYPA
ncbi:MAG: hypothetical protein A2145_05880 [candidate division Zixibacteria bacterium RBG_16_40_9]|nr:MAG: hypothetical protein A2145_05880 [candidate division Zixibacteria bacterium RBG_16_40_9]